MFSAALVYILAVMSPGPNFLLVSRYSAAGSVRAGIGASLGIVIVGLLFSISSVTGLVLLINRFPSFNKMATIIGAIYLFYIAVIIVWSAFKPTQSVGELKSSKLASKGFWQAWKIGVLTNITNIKTIAFMVSIFAGFLVVERSAVEKVSVIAICSGFEILWYSSVSLVFGQGAVQRFYARYSRQIDIGLAVFLVAFAVQNIWLS